MDKKLPRRFFWHAATSNGGTLSLDVNVKEAKNASEKTRAIASSLKQAVKSMQEQGYIPSHARLMSSRDIADEYGKTRQYWEKLLNEGKILYKETSAGRITTDLWVAGYLGKREEVDRYIKNVQTILKRITETKERHGAVLCPICEKTRFEFNVNMNGNVNGICRSCSFHVHTMSDQV